MTTFSIFRFLYKVTLEAMINFVEVWFQINF